MYLLFFFKEIFPSNVLREHWIVSAHVVQATTRLDYDSKFKFTAIPRLWMRCGQPHDPDRTWFANHENIRPQSCLSGRQVVHTKTRTRAELLELSSTHTEKTWVFYQKHTNPLPLELTLLQLHRPLRGRAGGRGAQDFRLWLRQRGGGKSRWAGIAWYGHK